MEFKRSETHRGFSLIEFTDHYGVECSLQKSSLATEDAIWFGANSIGLKRFMPGDGWRDVELEQSDICHHIANTRMHLTRDQVAALLPELQRFVDTGGAMTWEPKVGDKAMYGDKWPTVVKVERLTKTTIVTSDGKRWRRQEFVDGYPLIPFGYRNPMLKRYDAKVIAKHNQEVARPVSRCRKHGSTPPSPSRRAVSSIYASHQKAFAWRMRAPWD